MEIRKLSEKDNNVVRACIADIITKYTDEYVEAIYINSYRVDEIDYIDVQFVNNSISSVKKEIIECSINNIIIRKIDIPSIDFSYGLNHYRERFNAMNLLNSTIVMDTKDEYYKALADEAKKFGYGKYENNISFEPPINIAKVKKLK